MKRSGDPERDDSRGIFLHLKKIEQLTLEEQESRLVEIEKRLQATTLDKEILWSRLSTADKMILNKYIHALQEEKMFLIEAIDFD